MSSLSAIPNVFDPGVTPSVFLPVDGDQAVFVASLEAGLSGDLPLQKCFDKYGIQWKWSTFEILSGIPVLSSTRTPYPSSWGTVSCLGLSGNPNGTAIITTPGIYPKKWRNEGGLSAEYFSPVITSCTADKLTWTLSTLHWTQVETIPLSVSSEFIYTLKLQDYGFTPTTINKFQDTPVTVRVQATGTCCDLLAPSISCVPAFIDESYTFNVVTPPNIKLYTPNRFNLTGVNINFENVTTNLTYVTALKIDLDDSKEIFLTGSNVTNSFSVSYDVIGFKTLRVTSYLSYTEIPYVTVLPNIIEVVNIYDIVSPQEYRSISVPIDLPWPEQPKVGINDWAVEDNINSCFTKLYENLNYLDSRGRSYNNIYSDYFGYLGAIPNIQTTGLTGCPTWTWEDLDCLNTSLPYSVTWRDVLIPSTSAIDPTTIGQWVECGTWIAQDCRSALVNPNCNQKYCVDWNWRARRLANSTTTNIFTTWQATVSGGQYQKRWFYEPCEESRIVICDEGVWNVNLPNLDTYYDPIPSPAVQQRCIYTGVVSKQNKLYTSLKTIIKLFDSDYTATYESFRDSFDGVLGFSNIKNICMDSSNKIYVLDSILSQVAVYTYETDTPGDDWTLFTNWGGFGSVASTNKFSNPNDIHIDQLDNVWVTDTGNNCIKHYSNTGTWLNTITDDDLKIDPPLSVAVDSQNKLHVLTNKEIRIYSYDGVYEQSYQFSDFVTSAPVKINTSYNREIIYVAFTAQVLKFFRNGIFAGYIIQEKENLPTITGLYQDEFRNLLITAGDKILKYPDLMTQKLLKGLLPSSYWSLQDILINKEEYIQNWVYTKSFQRMWDNIEIFRHTLLFNETDPCKRFKPPFHGKEKMIIGQNEIVTATTVNRVLTYLWENFTTLVDYFDPNCKTIDL